MRRSVVALGVGAAMAGAWVASRSRLWARWRARLGEEIGPGAMPGELGSRINSWLNTELYAQVASELELRPDDELLDVGCGAGAFLARHGAPARFVAGLDLSPAKAGLARQRLADRIVAGTAEIVQGDAGSLPWKDGRFSVVTTMDAIGWFPDPAQAVKEMYRVLRPGGRAVLQIGFTGKAFGGALTVMPEPDVRRMTEAAGFADISIAYRPTAGDWRIYDALLRLFGWEQLRLVRAVRPAAVLPVEAPAAEEPVLVGSA